ncbi:AEC family transporter [Granulosicoccaceae sp. 1_MG-2023]|nr:AEC family transporter [Granulosicoccaceae sp. 1_MG-2023]
MWAFLLLRLSRFTMLTVIQALWPLFVLIIAGYLMRRSGFPGDAFWPGAERLNYFVLFPALLFRSLAGAPLNDPALLRVLLAVLLTLGICSLGLAAARRLRHWPAGRYGVYVQGVLRFNTYLGLSATAALFGDQGLMMAAVFLAALVPVVNVLSVLAFSGGQSTGWRARLMPILKNPLILACALGALFNVSGLELHWGSERLVDFLANTSLPLGLLTVGAALKPELLRGHLHGLLGNSLSRLLIAPLVAWCSMQLLHLPPMEGALLVLFFSLPTAPTAYVLTRQLNGDAELMAGIITLQTLLSGLSLMLILSYLL